MRDCCDNPRRAVRRYERRDGKEHWRGVVALASSIHRLLDLRLDHARQDLGVHRAGQLVGDRPVQPKFLAEHSDPDEGRYFWSYTIEIANGGEATVQLTHRHWRITDATGRCEEVRGPGVIGEQPTLRPGQAFRYTSGCPLTTPSGIMVGTYRMVDEGGNAFEVQIPAFSLDSPYAHRVVN